MAGRCCWVGQWRRWCCLPRTFFPPSQAAPDSTEDRQGINQWKVVFFLNCWLFSIFFFNLESFAVQKQHFHPTFPILYSRWVSTSRTSANWRSPRTHRSTTPSSLCPACPFLAPAQKRAYKTPQAGVQNKEVPIWRTGRRGEKERPGDPG